MPTPANEQTDLLIGVDVGGTFTDLIAYDPATGVLRSLKTPSTPPEFHRAVGESVRSACEGRPKRSARVIHGSTVATNALLQRAGEQIAFVTTEGFRDMLLIGRQNRPKLYALNIERPAPITGEDNWFTVRERLDAQGRIVTALTDDEIDRLVTRLRARGFRHVAICLLFSFVNPMHERRIANRCADAGMTVSLSSTVLPEFREYERASTTAINASLRPTVEAYLKALRGEMPDAVAALRITQSAGGTLTIEEASASAAKLVLSGPAGGVMGAAFIAQQAGIDDPIITYDMGGTSTDVATVISGQPQWTTASSIDGLPIGLPMLDIHTVGAGGGSIAYLDAGGALRVGPRSAGAVPGPACYGRGGTEPTVTDANLLLGRIVPDQFLGGQMSVDAALAERAIEPLARAMNRDIISAALGIVRIAEANMASAIRAVTARRGHDPRGFSLVSFGGAGGLHACALAEALEIPRVIIPPYAGVLSALGMVVAPPVVDAARTVVHLAAEMNDAVLNAEFAQLATETARSLPEGQTDRLEYFADVRFRGQSHELKVQTAGISMAALSRKFHNEYRTRYGRPPRGRAIEVVTLRVRRMGHRPRVTLPTITPAAGCYTGMREARIIDSTGVAVRASILRRDELIAIGKTVGPLLMTDAEATAFIPAGWVIETDDKGIVTCKPR